MKRQTIMILMLVCGCVMTARAQEKRPAHTSMWLTAGSTSAVQVPFAYGGEGVEYRVKWGMDVAWNSSSNVQRGTNHIGKENISYGRISFQPNELVGEDLQLTSRQKQQLRSRVQNILLSGTTEVLLNCDHEALNDYNGFDNYVGKPEAWYRVIKASVIYAESLGVKVVSIAPFNEPDYSSWGEGSQADFRAIAKLLQEDPDLAHIRICAGNTLNPDYALSWYNYMKPYVQEGNTHQLAGTFDNYANFFKRVRDDGNIATADELHNTMEAFVATEYGLQNGIWWGFDGVARGNFCKATSGGARLGYGENRNAWGAACVYRLPDGTVDAFAGVSERQAQTCSFEFVSKSDYVFYDGVGPVRNFVQTIPGGTGYATEDQRNAERLIHVTRGNDVADRPIANGTYMIMSARSRRILTTGGNALTGAKVVQTAKYSGKADDTWSVEAVPSTFGGDFSYHHLRNSAGQRYLNVLNNSLSTGGEMIAYDAGGGLNEQWHFVYAGAGNYYIQSHLSGLYLFVSSNTANPVQRPLDPTNSGFRWRLLPVGAALELTPPSAPTDLVAAPQIASVHLSWTAPSNSDLAYFNILRGEAVSADGENWQTIGRSIVDTEFVDNTAEQGKTYIYNVIAVDQSGNRSRTAATATAGVSGNHGLVARYMFESSVADSTSNILDAVFSDSPSYNTSSSLVKQGKSSLTINTQQTGQRYLMLPPAVGCMPEMTIAMWARWRGGNNWQRLFDFGSGTDTYFFLTPSNGSNKMSFAIKNGGEEQLLTCDSYMPKNTWQHIAVTIAADKICIYVGGELWAESSDISLRPNDINPALCYVGRSQFTADPYFYGYIDDLSIYNYALSKEEIASVMEGVPTDIEDIATQNRATLLRSEYYTLDGRRLQGAGRGVVIERQFYSDGTVTTRKTVKNR